MPNQIKEPNKNKTNKSNHQTNQTKNKPTTTDREKDKRQRHIDPTGTVERMMSYASPDGLVWRDKPKQTNKTRT
jgi:hypothetical protein